MLFYLLKKKKHKPEKKKAPDARVYLIKKKTTDHHHLHDRGRVVVGRSLSGTATKSTADYKKNPAGQAVDEAWVLKEKNGDGATRMTRKQRQRLKRKMKGGS